MVEDVRGEAQRMLYDHICAEKDIGGRFKEIFDLLQSFAADCMGIIITEYEDKA